MKSTYSSVEFMYIDDEIDGTDLKVPPNLYNFNF